PPGLERPPEPRPPADPGGQQPHLRVVRPHAQTAFEFGPGARQVAGPLGGPGGVKPAAVEEGGRRKVASGREKAGEDKEPRRAATGGGLRTRAGAGRGHLTSFVSSNL